MPAAVTSSEVWDEETAAARALLARGADGVFHWSVIVPFTVAAILGSLAGKRVADRISGASLTRSFAVLLLLVAAYVLVRALTGA